MAEFENNELLSRAFPGEGLEPSAKPLRTSLQIAYEGAAANVRSEFLRTQDENRVVDSWDDEEYVRII